MVQVRKKYLITFLATLGLLWLSMGCKQTSLVVQITPEIIPVPKVEVVPFVMPGNPGSEIYAGLADSQAVYHFYERHGFELRWLQDSVPVLADSMMYLVGNVRYNGLLPQDYHYAELREMPVSPFGRKVRYRKEALLTDAFLAIAQDLKYGRIDVRNDQKVIDSLALNVLENALSKKQIGEFLESQEPRYPQYQLLKSSLREMLNNQDSSDRRVLLSGVTYDSVAEHKKIQQVEVNMERWRSEMAEFGDRYIWINIPSYSLRVVEENQSVLESRIIVGHPDTPTPTLGSTVESISLYPYWHVPRKIAVEELLPAIQQDSSYLRRNDFEVLDKNGAVRIPATLDWKKFNKDYFPFSLRQREGTRNSLGIIKFVFDNPYAVFLHDTNAKGLFRRSVRALSHGCIRMEKAVELARYLVPEPGTIDKRLQQKKQITLGVRLPIRIYVRYFTCESKDDALEFYDDIYRLDRNMIKSLYNPERTKLSSL